MDLFKLNIPDDIWMPIIVALVTTLVIGPIVGIYIKPRIEAHQQRLIRDRQQIDEVIFKFQKLSLSTFALSKVGDELVVAHNEVMLQQAHQSAYELMNAMSRLSPIYVQKHSQHIGATVKFIGYFLGYIKTLNIRELGLADIEKLQNLASDLEKFDIYFRANVGLLDSQEPWFKRLYWWLFEKRNTVISTANVLKKYNLIDSSKVPNSRKSAK